ncbi:ComEA family DNA-binding protein [Pseudomonas wayambapalatensis]|uniref:ComEA family DNA-binding protein n=1 Tax=Pseudomonas wayambapalatensis TaxID=485895 RepID=UPI003CEEE2F3
MRNSVLSYLFLPLFACLSVSAHAVTQTVEQMPRAAMATGAVQAQSARLDLNKADVQVLEAGLSGIGKAKAEAIVAYREANGPFTSVDELLEIKGIGNALLERNRDKLKVE